MTEHELRTRALELALEGRTGWASKAIIEAAEEYYIFLKG